jgi:predicted Zn-dependent protease
MTVSRIEALLALVAQEPSDGTGHYMLGPEYFKAQNYPEAVDALRRYLRLAQGEGAVYQLLAQFLARIGDVAGARAAYQDVLAAATRHRQQPMIDEYTQAFRDME